MSAFKTAALRAKIQEFNYTPSLPGMDDLSIRLQAMTAALAILKPIVPFDPDAIAHHRWTGRPGQPNVVFHVSPPHENTVG